MGVVGKQEIFSYRIRSNKEWLKKTMAKISSSSPQVKKFTKYLKTK